MPGSPSIPRTELHAVYDALVAAADFFALRNRHRDGFDFDDAAAMYRAYENRTLPLRPTLPALLRGGG